MLHYAPRIAVDEVKAEFLRNHATLVLGSCRSPMIGRSIHEKPGRWPVHQMTFVTSMVCASSVTGNPSRTSTIRPTRVTPAGVKSFGFTRISGVARARKFGRILRPIGVRTVSR